MNIDEIFQLWKQDSKLDESELGRESAKIPELHHKYFKILSKERLILKKKTIDDKVLRKDAHEYYNGVIDQETMKARSWEPLDLRILKADIQMYIDTNADIVRSTLDLAVQQEKVDILESIIRTVNNRGFHVKNSIDWAKFTNGVN